MEVTDELYVKGGKKRKIIDDSYFFGMRSG